MKLHFILLVGVTLSNLTLTACVASYLLTGSGLDITLGIFATLAVGTAFGHVRLTTEGNAACAAVSAFDI